MLPDKKKLLLQYRFKNRNVQKAGVRFFNGVAAVSADVFNDNTPYTLNGATFTVFIRFFIFILLNTNVNICE